MTGINGNFGLFGNNNNRRIETNAANNKKEVKTNIPINNQKAAEHVENKELGDELLTGTNFYPGLNLHTSGPKKVADLDDLAETLKNMDLSRADKKGAFYFNFPKNILVSAYSYGIIDSSTISGLKDGKITSNMAADVLADVEIAF